jgi:hypothetical protein
VTVRDVSTETLEVVADVRVPSVLVVTDNYAASWTAVPWEAGGTETYRVLPANYLLRGIPLTPGRHHIRLEYRPTALAAGAWVTSAALLAWIGGLAVITARMRRSSSR